MQKKFYTAITDYFYFWLNFFLVVKLGHILLQRIGKGRKYKEEK